MAVLKTALLMPRLTRARQSLTGSPLRMTTVVLVLALAGGTVWAVPRAAQSRRWADRAAVLEVEQSSAVKASARASAVLTAARFALLEADTDLAGLVAAAARDSAAIEAAQGKIHRLERRIAALQAPVVQSTESGPSAPAYRIQPFKPPKPKWCYAIPDVENSCYD